MENQVNGKIKNGKWNRKKRINNDNNEPTDEYDAIGHQLICTPTDTGFPIITRAPDEVQ